MKNMEMYGIGCLYHIDKNYRIHECKICKTKWFDRNYRWKEWNSKGISLKRFYKKDRQIAITATARKLAIIIWKMITHKQKYKPTETHMF